MHHSLSSVHMKGTITQNAQMSHGVKQRIIYKAIIS